MTAAAVIALSIPQVATSSGAAGVNPSPSAPSSGTAADAPRASAPDKCSARKALRYYQRQYVKWRDKMGADSQTIHPVKGCPRYLASVWKRRAALARRQYELWFEYHWNWRSWLPDKWQRIGACETGYGQRPGRWDWNSGTYQGAFGFYHGSWDAFVPHADPKAGPYPSEAYLATPRQQYEVALAIWRRYGFSGWGCRGA